MKKASRNPRVYLEDIDTAIRRIEEYTVDGELSFFEDGMVQDAVIRQLAVIGEAAAKLPTPLKAMHSTIPWKQVIGMHNVLIHDYSETNVKTVWNTVRNDLPALKRAVAAILTRMAA